jgi:hypothetical protein
MDTSPANIEGKWRQLQKLGFEWGGVKKTEIDWKDPINKAFPPKEVDESDVAKCWIKHKTWNFKITVQQKVPPDKKHDKLWIQGMWFKSFDQFLDARNIDALQAVKIMFQLKNRGSL